MGVLGKADEPHPCWPSTRLSCDLSFLSLEVPVDLHSGVSPGTKGKKPACSSSLSRQRVWPQFVYAQDCFAAYSSNGAGAGWSVRLCGVVRLSLTVPWGRDGARRLELGGDLVMKTGMLGGSHKVVTRCHSTA